MAKKDASRRQQDLKRRLGQRGGDAHRSREELAQTLGDPERFAQCLQTFSSLALLNESLYPCRFEHEAFLTAALAFDPATLSDEERADVATVARAFRAAVIPAVKGDIVLERCQITIKVAMESTPNKDVLLALTAAGALLSSCRQEESRDTHPFWDLLFELTLTDTILSGQLLIRMIREAHTPDPVEVSKAFAKLLASDDDLSAELDRLGLDDPNPTELATAFVEIVTDPNIYHLQLDAILHLARTHVQLAETVGARIPAEGLSPELRETILTRCEAAYAADVSPGLSRELAGWFKRRLQAFIDEPEAMAKSLPDGIEPERRRCLVTYMALQALPPTANDLLYAVYAQSLIRAKTQAPELERAFVNKLWSEPTDLFALDEYEKFLIERNESNRSRRVRDYREGIRAEKAAAKASAKEVSETEEPTS